MHVILGLLGSIVSILYFLDRFGIDIGWLNPWSWRRRRAWAKKFDGDPVYSLENPVDIAAIFVVGTAKLAGDLTTDQKDAVLELFQDKFSLDERSAIQLLGSTSHLLASPQLIGAQLENLVSRNKQTFAPDQAASLLEMIEKIATIEVPMNDAQTEFIDTLRSTLVAPEQSGTWS